MCPPTDIEMEQFPHVIFTSDMEWNPQLLDNEISISDVILDEEDDDIPHFFPII